MTDQLQRLASTGLIVAGLTILLVTGGLFGYGQVEEYLVNRDVAEVVPDVPTAVAEVVSPTAVAAAVSEATPTVVATIDSNGAPVLAATSVPDAQPSSTPLPTESPTAVPILPIQRLIATPIGLDTKVVESPIVNGEWNVPKFVAGHLAGTAQPLQGSNVVLSGHVQSISSGNVFARIGELKAGDIIKAYTRAVVVTYVVSNVEVVPNNDVAVVRPSSNEILTLITCTGKWLPLQRDYDSRIVIIANRQS